MITAELYRELVSHAGRLPVLLHQNESGFRLGKEGADSFQPQIRVTHQAWTAGFAHDSLAAQLIRPLARTEHRIVELGLFLTRPRL